MAAAMGTRFGVDLDGDVEMRAPQPVYEFIEAPKLSSWYQAFLIAVTGECFEGVVATVKGSVEPAVLETLATYVLKKRVDEVEDTEILSQMQKCWSSLKNTFIPDIGTLFRKTRKMNIQMYYCNARIFYGNATNPDYKGRMKARCAILGENNWPRMLKEQVERLMKYESDYKMDDAALFDLILKHTRLQHHVHVQSVECTAPQLRGQLP
ncbi:hypothetical protein PHMEG_00020020 [Phytophthora megakarya]|uniref:Uncharacterized protein n=1 Tax=Phytophthora megakarya TaxID=4795 RepID=A0A225VQ64_9STRA|nr:hypothetical protein PHMEG_00020020 [Phytophthora megakarya]